jgi:hypothetical protein
MVKDSKTRIKKYKEKLAPDTISSRFSTLKQTSTERMSIAISSMVDLENRVKQLLADKIGNPFLNFCYLGFAKEIFKIHKTHKGETLIKEVELVKNKWTSRGFDPDILDGIINLFGVPIIKIPPPPPPIFIEIIAKISSFITTFFSSIAKTVSILTSYTYEISAIPEIQISKLVSILTSYVYEITEIPIISKLVSILTSYVYEIAEIPEIQISKLVSILSNFSSSIEPIPEIQISKIVSILSSFTSSIEPMPPPEISKLVSIITSYIKTIFAGTTKSVSISTSYTNTVFAGTTKTVSISTSYTTQLA